MRAGCLHPSRQSFILCLSSMAQSEREDTEYTFLEYTEKWVCAVDRGGLFHVSDEVFTFFCELETKVRVFLQKLVSKSLGKSKEEILDEIVNDGDIQFHWSMLCTDLDQS